MPQDYTKIIEFLNTQHNMLLCGHEQPDGDCLGSMLAVYQAFSGQDKNWRMVCPDQIPENFDFLPGLEQIIKPDQIDISVEAVLMLDGRGLHRTGYWLKPYLTKARIFCIDHHMGDSFKGEHLVLESDASATAEIIAAIIEQAGIKLSDDAATNIYSAIAADTGCFRFLNTTSRSLTQAARLLPQIDLEQIRIHLFEDCSIKNLRLKGHCCSTMETDCGGQLCYAVIDSDTLARYAAGSDDLYGIVNFTLMPHGVQVGILFEEYDDYIKVSFRSRDGFNVNQLAKSLGGGGHKLASGARLDKPLEKSKEKVIKAAKDMFFNGC